jgi:tetratricopeptide (TPR) repeat protein
MSPMSQSTSAASVGTENWSEDTHSCASGLATTIDANDKLEDAKRAVTRLSVDHPEWLNMHMSRALASLFLKRFKETSRCTLLAECIDIQRQIRAVCTTVNPIRAISASDLASSLWTNFMQSGEESLLAEAIDLLRESLSPRPTGHPDRSISCIHLSIALRTYFDLTGEQSLLAEAINLDREALSLRPSGHPDRSQSCHNLAISLQIHFDQTGEESLLTEAIELDREALSLKPNGHPERSQSCNNLASSLWKRFDQTGEEVLLAEAIKLNREGLSLLPDGHPDRPRSCTNLALSLWTWFNQTGEESLLVEAIELHRESLSLRPCGHPDRPKSCSNLAGSLWTRFNQTGEESMIIEAIELHREALSLVPCGHAVRALPCSNLATSLLTYFNHTGKESLLAEAIELHREALSLRRRGHPHRWMSCSNLALSLHTRFEQAKEESLLVEAIHLHREALSLRTRIHPDRFEACKRLVTTLRTLFELTGDESLLVEAIHLSKDAIEIQSQQHPNRWSAIINLGHVYLNRRFSQYSPVLAIDYIQQACSLISNDWPALLSEVAQLTNLIDLPLLSQNCLSQLLQCFSAAMDLASRVAGFVLDSKLQLRYLKSSQHLGPRAYWCAHACRQPELGLELVERSRAMMWTQALHMRDPQLSGAPPELASELEVLLKKMHTLRAPEGLMSLSPHNRDVRHKNSARIHYLIQQIRAMPGLERFMQGLSFKELAQCASHNAVVILVAAEGECHALILSANDMDLVTLKLSDITPAELTAMSIVAAAAQWRGTASDDIDDDCRGMNISSYNTISHQTRSTTVLGKLWKTVVKPVLDGLGIQVVTISVIFSVILLN